MHAGHGEGPKKNKGDSYGRDAFFEVPYEVSLRDRSSGYTADRMKMEGILEPGFDYLLKPASPNELLKKIREMLDR